MTRVIFGKVMWVGRATVFVVGLAVILALVFGVATSALGANGKPFLLGRYNVASAVSTLVKQGPGPALKLQVGSGPPLAVNSQARVANLNAASAGRADSAASAGFAANAGNANNLDGKDSTEFLGETEKAADADQLDGKDLTDIQGPRAYAYVNGWGYDFGPGNPTNTVDESRSRNIADSNVTREGVGTLCFNNLGFTPKSIQVQPTIGQGAYNKIAFADVIKNWAHCPGTENASVRLADVNQPYGTFVDGGFYVEIN